MDPKLALAIAARVPMFYRTVETLGAQADALAAALHTLRGSGSPSPASPSEARLLALEHDADAAWFSGVVPAHALPKHGALLVAHAAERLEAIARSVQPLGYACYGILSGDGDEGSQRDLSMWVARDYDPVLHARTLFDAARYRDAYEVLSMIRPELMPTADSRKAVVLERLLARTADLKQGWSPERLDDLFESIQVSYEAIAAFPMESSAYVCAAEAWRVAGQEHLAKRALSSIEFALGGDVRLARIREGIRPSPSDAATRHLPLLRPSLWHPPSRDRRPRVLFVQHPRPHYGLDVLYYGLCRVLGADHVVDWPYKPTLHGNLPEQLAHYPCMFDEPGTAFELDDAIRMLREGAFDLVLWGDCEGGVPVEDAKRLLGASPGTPVIVVDQLDSFEDPRSAMRARYGGFPESGYLKREFLAGHDYGGHARPLPFAYPRIRALAGHGTGAREGLFWAGHRQMGLRRLYLEHIEQRFGVALDRKYDQVAYIKAIRSAAVAVNFFGCGFDTVRYWEIPAQGCALLAERLPIVVPYDFVDGEQALFFEDLAELLSGLTQLLDDRDRCVAVATAGSAHYAQFHTAEARARMALTWVSELTGAC